MRFSSPLLAVVLAFAPVPVMVSAAGAADAAKAVAEEKIGKIEGIEIARKGGGFLGIKTEGVVLRVTFYDEKKKPVAADAVRIAARWKDSKPRNTVLLPVAPETLASPSVISRPFNYIIFLTLIGAEEKVIETHSLNLNGS